MRWGESLGEELEPGMSSGAFSGERDHWTPGLGDVAEKSGPGMETEEARVLRPEVDSSI